MVDDRVFEQVTNSLLQKVTILNQQVSQLSMGINLKGEVNYYSDLPLDPKICDGYIIRYHGEYPSVEVWGVEAVWLAVGELTQWVLLGPDMAEYAKKTVVYDIGDYFGVSSMEVDQTVIGSSLVDKVLEVLDAGNTVAVVCGKKRYMVVSSLTGSDYRGFACTAVSPNKSEEILEGNYKPFGEQFLVLYINNIDRTKSFYLRAPDWSKKADLVDGKVPLEQLPDITNTIVYGYYHSGVFYEDAEHFRRIEPVKGKIYVDQHTSLCYYWSGIAYESLSKPSPDTFVFNQAVPAALWTIVHSLNKYPSVSVVDSAGTAVVGSVHYLSSTKLQIEFSAAFSGVAYLN